MSRERKHGNSKDSKMFSVDKNYCESNEVGVLSIIKSETPYQEYLGQRGAVNLINLIKCTVWEVILIIK